MRILRPKATAVALGISTCTLWRWERTIPDFPVAYRIGPNAKGYDEDEIKAFAETRRVVRAVEPEARA